MKELHIRNILSGDAEQLTIKNPAAFDHIQIFKYKLHLSFPNIVAENTQISLNTPDISKTGFDIRIGTFQKFLH